MRSPFILPALALSAALAGCQEPLTQVVVVLQSDLVVPTETDGIQTALGEGPFAPMFGGPGFTSFGPLEGGFPLSIGVTSEGATSSFSIRVQLMVGFSQVLQASAIVVDRTVTDVRFVDQQTMMLVVPMLRACACQGTSCPNPGNPLCDAIDKPALQPFDSAVAPPSTMMNVGGGGVGPSTRPGQPPRSIPDAGVSPS